MYSNWNTPWETKNQSSAYRRVKKRKSGRSYTRNCIYYQNLACPNTQGMQRAPLPFIAMQVINRSFELDGLDHLSCSQGIQIHTAVGWAGAERNKKKDFNGNQDILKTGISFCLLMLLSTRKEKSQNHKIIKIGKHLQEHQVLDPEFQQSQQNPGEQRVNINLLH